VSELLYKEEIFELVGLCMEIHRELGKGHDEVIYKDALVVELNRAGIPFRARKTTKSRTKELSCLTITTRTSLSGRRFSLRPKLSKN
jgi:GxxExxY protein